MLKLFVPDDYSSDDNASTDNVTSSNDCPQKSVLVTLAQMEEQ